MTTPGAEDFVSMGNGLGEGRPVSREAQEVVTIRVAAAAAPVISREDVSREMRFFMISVRIWVWDFLWGAKSGSTGVWKTTGSIEPPGIKPSPHAELSGSGHDEALRSLR